MTAKTLPPTRKSSLGRVDLSRERDWIVQHRHEYPGEWVVLGEGRLLGHTSDSATVSSIVDEARKEGVETPYVKFIADDSASIWIGWL
jgi:hypothetical protein